MLEFQWMIWSTGNTTLLAYNIIRYADRITATNYSSVCASLSPHGSTPTEEMCRGEWHNISSSRSASCRLWRTFVRHLQTVLVLILRGLATVFHAAVTRKRERIFITNLIHKYRHLQWKRVNSEKVGNEAWGEETFGEVRGRRRRAPGSAIVRVPQFQY